jgi:hypothetical protein
MISARFGAGYRQVFGLTGAGFTHLPATASQPIFQIGQCEIVAFVSAHRCGAAPDSHRVPFLTSARKTDSRINIRCIAITCQPLIVVYIQSGPQGWFRGPGGLRRSKCSGKIQLDDI